MTYYHVYINIGLGFISTRHIHWSLALFKTRKRSRESFFISFDDWGFCESPLVFPYYHPRQTPRGWTAPANVLPMLSFIIIAWVVAVWGFFFTFFLLWWFIFFMILLLHFHLNPNTQDKKKNTNQFGLERRYYTNTIMVAFL